jgi:circadian clock protein KaiB
MRAPRDTDGPLDDASCELTLFVSGASQLSARAIADATALGEIHLGGRYHLCVVDVHIDAAAALSSGVLATPTLVKTSPLPVRRVAGDLSHAERVLLALDLPLHSDATAMAGGALDVAHTSSVST